MSNQSYTQIKETASSFILATNPLTPGTNDFNSEALRALAGPNFQLSWGHAYFVSKTPHLQASVDLEGFLRHMAPVQKLMDTWKAEVRDVLVDVERGTAIAKADFYMTPKERETVNNEIIFFVEVVEGKVGKVVEWVDPIASGRLGELFKMNKEAAGN